MNNKIDSFKGKKLIFLFDTNIYRRIVEIVNDNRFFSNPNKFIFHAMAKKEQERGCHSVLSITTSQELIAHLKKDDKMFTDCYNALRFQFFHTQILQRPKLIPSIDSLLSYFFYSTDSKDERIKFAKYVLSFLEKLFWLSKDIDSLKNEIDRINADFLVYKNEFYLFFKEIAIHTNKGDVDSENINEYSYIEIIKNYIIQRTKYFCKEGECSEISTEKILEFEKYFKESLLHFRYLFESISNEETTSNELKKIHWNAIKDFHIVFEWCFAKYLNKEKDVCVILVTEDQSKNFKSTDENNEFKSMHDRNTDVWHMWEYFEFIGFSVDKTNPGELVLRLDNSLEVESIAE